MAFFPSRPPEPSWLCPTAAANPHDRPLVGLFGGRPFCSDGGSSAASSLRCCVVGEVRARLCRRCDRPAVRGHGDGGGGHSPGVPDPVDAPNLDAYAVANG